MTARTSRRYPIGVMLICFHSLGALAGGPVGNVTDARVSANKSGDDWLVKGGSYYQDQYSPLKDVNDSNVAKLGFAWAAELPDPMGQAAEPIVVDGTIYLSGPRSRVYAIDAASGRILWKFDPHVRLDFGFDNSIAARVNRGVAVWEGKVYVGTADCRLLAIDAAKGSPVWESKVCDPKVTGITGAPRVARGRVFTGYMAEGYIRGAVAAFDALTGKELWRFWTVPSDPAKGFENAAMAMAAKTWSGNNWWEDSGGGVWDAITFDPVTGLVLLGTSKTPNRNANDERLFTGSIVAVNAETGAYAWHFRTSTSHRQTENFHIALADIVIDGQKRHVAMTVPRNGTFYVLDAATGKLIASRPVVEQADPFERASAEVKEWFMPGVYPNGPEDCGNQKCFGVHQWWPMSYSPATQLVYIPIMDVRRSAFSPDELPMVGRLVAWDPVHQATRWSVEHPIIINSGVLSTAGNLVFQGQGTGEFAAYAADSGRKLWSVATGSAIDAVPVTYKVNGEQYIVVPVGWGGMFRLWSPWRMTSTATSRYGPSRLLAFKIGGRADFPAPHIEIPPVPRPPDQTYSQESVNRGRELVNTFGCRECHAVNLEGSSRWVEDGGIPDLRYMPPDVHRDWYAILLGGSHRAQGMMPFNGSVVLGTRSTTLTVPQADDIHAYVIDRAWAAYDAQEKAKSGH